VKRKLVTRRADKVAPGDVIRPRIGEPRKVAAVAFRRDGTGPVVIGFRGGEHVTLQRTDRVRVEVEADR
jgi:hypothetical protein